MADSVPVQKVKDYIVKYGIEEKLSEAVNVAIKQESTDPFRVISEYLKQFAEDAEDEEDDDEDVMDEEEERRMMERRGGGGKPAVRHQQVAAKKFEVPENWKPPMHDKPEEAKEFLKEAMASNKLMKSLAPSDREQLMHAFLLKEFAAGAEIIKQGDEGDMFYILYTGTADIAITGKGSVMKATKGIAFGELALLHGAPRAATVTAEEPVTAWALDEVSFKMILMGKSQTDAKDYKSMLESVPLIKECLTRGDLKPEQVQELAGALREEEYPAGRNILVEGDEGNHFYIIRDGEVKCTKLPENKEVSKRLTRGDFFGELALLSSDKRQATVCATQPTSVLVITRAEFKRLLGDLSEIISKSQSYQ